MLRLGTTFILTVILPVLLSVAQWHLYSLMCLVDLVFTFFELALEMLVPEVHIQQSFAFL